MTKYKITIEIESNEVDSKDLDKECETLRDEFVESDLYNLSFINVKWEELK